MNTVTDRAEIVKRFEALLDKALAEEEAPAGLPAALLAEEDAKEGEGAAEGSDAYSLWSALTALTQEIKLQGRAFQELHLTLSAQNEKAAEQTTEAQGEKEKAARREGERRVKRDTVRTLIDLRDRLARGAAASQSQQRQAETLQPAFWAKLFGKTKAEGDHSSEAVKAVIRGYEMALERVDQALDEFNAREIRCAGEKFDPRSMNAVDSVESADVPAGTVVEVYLSGYEWENEVFRPAQVKVAKGATSR